jgi:hypothetical protein
LKIKNVFLFFFFYSKSKKNFRIVAGKKEKKNFRIVAGKKEKKTMEDEYKYDKTNFGRWLLCGHPIVMCLFGACFTLSICGVIYGNDSYKVCKNRSCTLSSAKGGLWCNVTFENQDVKGCLSDRPCSKFGKQNDCFYNDDHDEPCYTFRCPQGPGINAMILFSMIGIAISAIGAPVFCLSIAMMGDHVSFRSRWNNLNVCAE